MDERSMPWMVYNNRGWLLCLMCPKDKTTHQGRVQYYLGVNTKRKKTRQVRAWVRMHEDCGFEGLE